MKSKIAIDAFQRLSASTLPIADLFGMRVESLTAGRARTRMPFKSALTRPGGTIAGPALMGLADYTMYAVLLSLIGRVEMAMTITLSTSFLRRPRAADVIGDGRMIKLGKRLAFMEVTLYSEGEDDPVAHATGTYSIPPANQPPKQNVRRTKSRIKKST